SATSMTANFTIAAGTAPGAFNVSVTTGGGTSGNQVFTVTGFSISSLSPATGTLAGGQRVILTGTNIAAGPVTVSFGGAYGAGAQRLSATQITVFAPPHASGAVDVVINSGLQVVTRTSAFTYSGGVSPSAFSPAASLGVARSDAAISALTSDV